MASTEPFPPADRPRRRREGVRAARPLRGATPVRPEIDAAAASATEPEHAARSGVRHGARAGRRADALRARKARVGEALHSGFPAWSGLQPVLLFLLAPAALVFAIVITGGNWEPEVLYSIAFVLGVYVFWSALRGVELVLACALFYLPFSSSYVIPLAPGVNGTNMLLLLGLFASVLRAADRREGWLSWPIGTSIVVLFAVISIFSGVTILREPGGYAHLVYGELLSYKAWIDQFIFYFIVVSCVRDIETAKRLVVYMAIGSIVLVLYSVPEMIEKGGRSTIEKSRIEGPHQQSNNFGGFVAYTLLPLIAYLAVNIRDLRAWLLVPYFLVAAKVLISTFSRGAYLAMAAGGVMAGFLKGKGFLAFWATMGLCFFLVFPQFVPESIMVRLSSITEKSVSTSAPAELDKSSAHRLILWRAAAEMILEDPITGKGFKGFPKLKAQYTEQPVHESDPHSMYLYIGSQMGLPALSLYLMVLGFSFWLGRRLSRHKEDRFIRVIGIGGAAGTACYAAICVFGSRAVNLEFTSYFWTYLVVMQVIYQREKDSLLAAAPKRQRRTAFDVASAANDGSAGESDGPLPAAARARDTNRSRGARRRTRDLPVPPRRAA